MTPSMESALKFIKEFGGLKRLACPGGGRWVRPEAESVHGELYVPPSTMSNLVKRGAVAYTEWTERGGHRVPIKCELVGND